MNDKLTTILFPLLGLVLILAGWHFFVILFDVNPIVLPSPGSVLVEMVAERELLLSESWVTMWECILGFLLAVGLGIPIAVVMTYSRIMNLMFYPLLIASQSIPKIALAPIIIVWFGTEIESKLVMAFFIAVFPMVVDTATGLRATSKELLEMARSLQCSRYQTFFKIQLPSALPFIFSGAKIAVTLAVIGAVIGEFLGADQGLGTLLLTANSQMNTALSWASLVILSILGIVLYAAVVLAEKLIMPWGAEDAHH
jgi:NitT/TauT family transport system permease protein